MKSQVRGRHEGACRRLNPEQEIQLQKLLIDKTPEQLKLPYALWTREPRYQPTDAYRRTLSQALGHDSAKAGEAHAYEEQAARVRQWLDEEYPQIQAKTKAEDAEIYWGDETGLRNDSQHERGYAL